MILREIWVSPAWENVTCCTSYTSGDIVICSWVIYAVRFAKVPQSCKVMGWKLLSALQDEGDTKCNVPDLSS